MNSDSPSPVAENQDRVQPAEEVELAEPIPDEPAPNEPAPGEPALVEAALVEALPAEPLEPAAGSTVSMTGAAVLVIVAVIAGSLYANLSSLVVNRANFRFFPPFMAGVNRNQTEHLAAEYNSIATAIVAGRGFSDPFKDQAGPTAWMPPVLCWILAGLRWVADGDSEIVIALFILLQDLALMFSGVMTVALSRRTTGRVWLPAALFVGAMAYYFRLCFQFTHDCWIVLLTLNLVIAGMIWLRPFEQSLRRAAVWGICGGLFALTSPIVGFTWAVAALATGLRKGRRRQFAVAVLMSILTVTPWVIRNYWVFGRLIPVKSNLAFELYQSQCLQAGGVLRGNIFGSHPYAADGEERWRYRKLGEMEYLDEKWEIFAKAVRDNPMDFVERVANRFFAATLEYSPFSPNEERNNGRIFFISQLVYPLPFLSLLLLLVLSPWRPLSSAQWIVIGVYLSYLLPYIIISYYDRYKFPVLAAEILMMVWAFDRIAGWFRTMPPTAADDAEAVIVVDEADPASGAA
ncbi:MAG: hypothetical protein L0Y71_20675 [Gemmataceae bacterium]|nr:hypothetical protein [Gemmataceae bacterium]